MRREVEDTGDTSMMLAVYACHKRLALLAIIALVPFRPMYFLANPI